VAENKKTEKDGEKGKGVATTPSTGAGSVTDIQRRGSVSQQLPGQNLSNATNTNLDLNLNQPFDLSTFDITSPSLYQNPQFNDPYTYGGSPTSPHFNGNLHFISTLPAIDRQMVFGAAYSGLDQSSNHNTGNQNLSSGVHNLNSDALGNFTSTNPWDQLDVTTYGFSDPFGGGGTGGMDTSSSAWLLPFNIEPPNFGGSVEDFGNTALDGMDLSDLGQGGSDVGGQYGDHKSGNGG